MKYPGTELTLSSKASNWKAYLADKIGDHFHGDVLDVGAGLGSNTTYLANSQCRTWTFLEPDRTFSDSLQKTAENFEELSFKFIHSTLREHTFTQKYDTICYLDVLEHIEDDTSEILKSQKLLKKNGLLIILVPSYPSLYSDFDKSVGHIKRYNRKDLQRFCSQSLILEKLFNLDSMGMVCSAINRYILKRDNIRQKDIYFWDKTMVPLSKRIDPLINFQVGKSLVAIFRKT